MKTLNSLIAIFLILLSSGASAQSEAEVIGTWKFRKWEVSKKEAGKKIRSTEHWSPYIITLNSDRTFTNVALSYAEDDQVVTRGRWKIVDEHIQLSYTDNSGMAMSTVQPQRFGISKVNRKKLILLFEDSYSRNGEGGVWMDVTVTYQRYTE